MTVIRRVALFSVLLSSVAAAQRAAPRLLQREARIQELQQLELESRLRANPDAPLGERALIDFGGYTTLNYLSLDDSTADNHVLREIDLVSYARVQLDGASEFFLRARTGYRDFNEGDSFDGRGDEPVDGDLDRAYYRVDLNAARAAYGGKQSDVNLIFKGGRDFAYWANGLVLAQVLDGGSLEFSNPTFSLEILGGVTVTRTVDFDPSRPTFDHNTNRGFYGAMLSAQVQSHRPFLYVLAQRDYNKNDELETGPIVTKFNYDSNYIGLGSTGNLSDRLRYGVELAYEFGDTLSNSFEVTQGGLSQVPQTTDDISALGLDARIDYLAPDTHMTRLGAEVILASGDPDRGSSNTTFNGNQPDTSDTAFNSFGLLNTGLAFAPAVSNMAALRLGASTFPFGGSGSLRRLQLGTDFFIYSKLRQSAPIDETTSNDEKFLGYEPDIYLNWQVASDVTLVLRYGAFFPNSHAFTIDDVRQFIYAGVTFAY